jgi:phosphatidate cytidylyltransferase
MEKELQKRILSSFVLIPIAIFFIIKGTYFFNFFILICLFISIYEWLNMSKKKEYKIPGIFFLILSFYSAYYLRNEFYGDYLYFIMIILICIFTDIGGYIFGNIFKGPKLTKISPKKTYSGVVGGYLFSIIFMTLFFNYADDISEVTYIETTAKELSLNNFILTIFISTVSQVGDIIVSYFKRKSKIKDTGKIIPGHGGLLDRIDGMIFAFPATYLIFKVIY